MVRVDPAVHAQAAKAAEMTGKSLAQWAEEHLRLAAQTDIKRAMPAQWAIFRPQGISR